MYKYFENIAPEFSKAQSGTFAAGGAGYLLSYLAGYKLILLFISILAASVAVIEIFIFKYIGDLVDAISLTSPEYFVRENWRDLVKAGLVMLVALPAVDLFHTMLGNQTFQSNFQARMLFAKHQHILKQDLSFFHRESGGKIANTLIQTSSAANIVMIKLLDTFVYASVFVISMAVLMSSIDPSLLLMVGSWLLAYIIVVSYFVPKLKHLSSQVAEKRSLMAGEMVDSYSNIATIKLYSSPGAESAYSKNYVWNYLSAQRKQARFMSSILIMIAGLNTFLIFGTIFYSIFLWSKGQITAGAIAASIAVVLRLYSMSHWIMWEASAFFNNLGTLRDGMNLWKRCAAAVDDHSLQQMSSVGGNAISFRNVDFSYDGCPPLFENLSVDIADGEKVGVVGGSGSGKSTFSKLLLNFYSPSGGSISIGGRSISSLDHQSLLDKVAVVTQEVELLDRTVKENLLVSRSGISEDEIVAATKIACAHDFIMELVDENGNRGYDARVGVRGGRLSGGQRQRLSIARAVLKKAPILILDEATSALDTELETQISHNLARYVCDMTVIVITHRESILSIAERIVVIENGKLVESGDRASLIRKNGAYSRIMSAANVAGESSQKEMCAS